MYNDIRKANLNWTSNDTMTSRQDLFTQATYSFGEIVESINIRNIFWDSQKWDSKTGWWYLYGEEMDVMHGSVIEQRHRRYGRCYTYSPDESVKDLGIYYVSMKL